MNTLTSISSAVYFSAWNVYFTVEASLNHLKERANFLWGRIKRVLDSNQTLFFIFLLLALSKKPIIDKIINKNPDRFSMVEKVEQTMTKNGQS